MAVHTIENEELIVQVSDHGGELVSIVKKSIGKEYLWNANPVWWNRHAPVLFPFVGGLKNKTYRYGGKDYTLLQHGFARDKEFMFVSNNGTEIWHRLLPDEATRAVYPFEFELETGVRLFHNQVIILWRVQNHSVTENMYFSIGGHPAFLCPLSGETSDRCEILFEGVPLLNTRMLEGGLAAKGLTQLELEKKEIGGKTYGAVKIDEHLFDMDAYVIEGHQTREVALAGADGKIYLAVKFDAPLFGVWAPSSTTNPSGTKIAPFVCIEPWYGRCDSVDFSGTLEEKEYINKLLPGQVFNKNYHICIY
ncbi:MAG: aldose 1-epimerase family protein [Lachnospiraceae bacterium]|nr:aldose 1-epimerase family protein [Lachnospiraceae bacterium]